MTARIIHADDYGITMDQSRRILDCCAAFGGTGALNSLSMFTGGPSFYACAELLKPYVQSGHLLVGLHLNLFEGTCCANPETIGLLADKSGVLTKKFGTLLFASLGSQRATLKEQMIEEFSCQISRFIDVFPQFKGRLRIDSHQHFHLIPLAFDAVFLAVKRCGCTVEHIRIPAEPLSPFLSTPSIWKDLRPINLIKAVTLKVLWSANKKKLPHYQSLSSVFSGVVLSGCMEHLANRPLLRKLQNHADKKAMSLELLFHPGGLSEGETHFISANPEFDLFYRSPHRIAEAEALRHLTDYL